MLVIALRKYSTSTEQLIAECGNGGNPFIEIKPCRHPVPPTQLPLPFQFQHGAVKYSVTTNYTTYLMKRIIFYVHFVVHFVQCALQCECSHGNTKVDQSAPALIVYIVYIVYVTANMDNQLV